MQRSKLKALVLTSVLAVNAAPGNAAVVVGVAPPAPIVEVVPSAPAVGYVWRQGYWSWNGIGYIWRPGVYVVAPRPGLVWVPGHWLARGGGWVWIAGRWTR
jgi:hypothetical protein